MATLKMGSTTVLTDTTLANAVQDNITRLGTVTAGTITSSTTFPTGGHILKISVHTASNSGGTAHTSGVNTVHTVDHTPLSGTNYLFIIFKHNYQLYGNAAGVSAESQFKFYHNGTMLQTAAFLGRYDQSNYSNVFHRIHCLQEHFYIAENHASASGSRTIYFTFTPTAGRHYWDDVSGEHSITIAELA